MSNPASISIGDPLTSAFKTRGRTVRARPTSAREALRNANICGEFLFLVASDGTWLLARLKVDW